jgi:hypothetical protein
MFARFKPARFGHIVASCVTMLMTLAGQTLPAQAQSTTWAFQANTFSLDLVTPDATYSGAYVLAAPRGWSTAPVKEAWFIVFVGDGSLRIHSVEKPTRCLDAAANNYYGFLLISKDCDGSPSQYWRFDHIANGQGQFMIRSNTLRDTSSNTPLCMQLVDGRSVSWQYWQSVKLAMCNASPDQAWSLISPPL